MNTWWAFMSRCAWDVFSGRLVSNPGTYHFSGVVGGCDYDGQVPGVRPARTLYPEWSTELLLIAVTVYLPVTGVSGWFLFIITITLLRLGDARGSGVPLQLVRV